MPKLNDLTAGVSDQAASQSIFVLWLDIWGMDMNVAYWKEKEEKFYALIRRLFLLQTLPLSWNQVD